MPDKGIGITLLLVSCLVVLGMVLNIGKLWFVIDILVILACGISGVLLIRK
ncbi:MAG: hypothetical protein JW803_05980 [Endomicrobiales bacterium]|nr:hypothetical protein [Endomicrobiales bacterium]